MMFVVRNAGAGPCDATIRVKKTRQTPAIVNGGAGKTDFFCVGKRDAMATLRDRGWEVVELRDGWYDDGAGGGVAIWGQGRYWELRDTPFTVAEAAGAPSATIAPSAGDDETVNVRGAIFGV